MRNRTNRDLGVCNPSELYSMATKVLVKGEQQRCFPEPIRFLTSKKCPRKCPDLVLRLNLYVDEEGLLRVKSKFKPVADHNNPILLPKNSKATELILMHQHMELSHAGVYSVLRELRKRFYIVHHFSVAKRTLRSCITCKRFHEPFIKINQGMYREFRLNPEQTPFRNVMIDHIGPYTVKMENATKKVWILIITCLYTRAINLKVCYDLSAKEFLNALQLHIFEFGVFSLCISDMGSQLISGANMIQSFLAEPETHSFFEEHGMKTLKFQN